MISTLLALTPASRFKAYTRSPRRRSSDRRTRTARLATGSLALVVGRSSLSRADFGVFAERGVVAARSWDDAGFVETDG